MFVISEKITDDIRSMIPGSLGTLKNLIQSDNIPASIEELQADMKRAAEKVFETTSGVPVATDSCSKVQGDTGTATMYNVQIEDSDITLGSNVTIINASFKHCKANIPDNSFIFGCSFTDCKILLEVSGVTLLNESTVKKQTIAIAARHLLWKNTSIPDHSFHITCDVLVSWGNHTATSNTVPNTSSINAPDKYVILAHTEFRPDSVIRADNPKYVAIGTMPSYYHRAAETGSKWFLYKDSVTKARNSSVEIHNRGCLVGVPDSENIKLVVGANSKVNTMYLRSHWYYRGTLKEINVADNSLADIRTLRRSTKTLYVKEGYEGTITNYTGTNRGGTVIVRKVHGDRTRRS